MSDEISSSVGGYGPSERQDNRWYNNVYEYGTDASDVIGMFETNMTEAAERSLTRTVLRQVVSCEVAQEIAASEYADDVEVYFPLHGFTYANSTRHQGTLLYLARNHPSRSGAISDEQIIRETDAPSEPRTGRSNLSAAERILQLRDNGFVFSGQLSHDDHDAVVGLLGNGFGWEAGEVINLTDRLADEAGLEPASRSLWLSTVRQGGQVVSLALAEKITLESNSGQLEMIESTEWITADQSDLRGRGIMAANLIAFYARIAEQGSFGTHGLPLVYAECNFASRSDRAGRIAGHHIPYRRPNVGAPQILRQHVSIGDSDPQGNKHLRDFNFTYVPRGIWTRDYNATQRAGILRASGEM